MLSLSFIFLPFFQGKTWPLCTSSCAMRNPTNDREQGRGRKSDRPQHEALANVSRCSSCSQKTDTAHKQVQPQQTNATLNTPIKAQVRGVALAYSKLPKSRPLEVKISQGSGVYCSDSRRNRKVSLSSLVGTAVTPARSLSDCFGALTSAICAHMASRLQPALPKTQKPSCELLHA